MFIKDRQEFASKPKPMTASKEMSVFDAVKRMSSKNFGSIIIVDENERLLGMFTERDLLKRVVAEGKDPHSVKLCDVMTTELRVAREDDSILEWLRIMSNERFRRLPVIDDENRITGIMTQGDFVSYTWPDLIYHAKQLVKASVSPDQALRPMLMVGAGLSAYTIALVAFFA